MRDLVRSYAIFPAIAKLAAAYLLLPVGTAMAERSFSTLNHIACAERSILNADHQDCLMCISADGPDTLTPDCWTVLSMNGRILRVA